MIYLQSDGWYELQLVCSEQPDIYNLKVNPSQVGKGPVIDGVMFDAISSGLEVGFTR